MYNTIEPCNQIECGFSNTYFGLCQTVAFLSIILFNSKTGWNANDRCLYQAIQLFVVNSSEANNKELLKEEENRFNEIIDILRKKNNGYRAVFYNEYNFDKFKNFIRIISKVKTTGNYEQNIHLEYEILNNLMFNNTNMLIMFKAYLSRNRDELINFMNIITYTLTIKYYKIDLLCDYNELEQTKKDSVLGYIIHTKNHMIPCYKCRDRYTYIDWGSIKNSNFNDIIKNYKSNNLHKIDTYSGQIRDFSKEDSIYPVNFKNMDDILYIIRVFESESQFLLTDEDKQVNIPTVKYTFNSNEIYVNQYNDMITFDLLYTSYYKQLSSQITEVVNNMYINTSFILSMIFSTNYSIIYKFVKKVFRYIDCIEGASCANTEESTYQSSYNEYIANLNTGSFKLSNTNKRITFIRNVIGTIIREAFRLVYMDVNKRTYDSYRDISHIPDATIHLCYLMYLYSFRSNVVTIFFDYPVYMVLMREMFMTKNLDVRRIDADFCLMKYRYKLCVDLANIASQNLIKYKSVIVKMRRANKLVKDVFFPVFDESFTTAWQSNP